MIGHVKPIKSSTASLPISAGIPVAASTNPYACSVQIEGPMQVARRSDMDMNGHINNVTYLGWALETVPEDIYLNYSLYQARSAHLVLSAFL